MIVIFVIVFVLEQRPNNVYAVISTLPKREKNHSHNVCVRAGGARASVRGVAWAEWRMRKENCLCFKTKPKYAKIKLSKERYG